MQFRLPQFLDIEDKVFGPFTLKQFAYLLGAIAFAYIFWKLIPFKIISIILILIFSGTFLALAFVKINSRPFADILESAYKFLVGNKTFIWQKKAPQKEEENKKESLLALLNKEKEEREKNSKKVSLDKIKELSSRLDILDSDRKEKLSMREHLIKRSDRK